MILMQRLAQTASKKTAPRPLFCMLYGITGGKRFSFTAASVFAASFIQPVGSKGSKPICPFSAGREATRTIAVTLSQNGRLRNHPLSHTDCMPLFGLGKAARSIGPESVKEGMKKLLQTSPQGMNKDVLWPVFETGHFIFGDEKQHLPQWGSAVVILPLLSDCAVLSGLSMV